MVRLLLMLSCSTCAIWPCRRTSSDMVRKLGLSNAKSCYQRPLVSRPWCGATNSLHMGTAHLYVKNVAKGS